MDKVFSLKALFRKIIMQWRIAVSLLGLAVIASLGFVLVYTNTKGKYSSDFIVYIQENKPLTSEEMLARESSTVFLKTLILSNDELNQMMSQKLDSLGLTQTEDIKYFSITANVVPRGSDSYQIRFSASCFTDQSEVAIQALTYYQTIVREYVEVTEQGRFGAHREQVLEVESEPVYNKTGALTGSVKYICSIFAVCVILYLISCILVYFGGTNFNSIEEFKLNTNVPILGVLTGEDYGYSESASKIAIIRRQEAVLAGIISLSIEHIENLRVVGLRLKQNGFNTLLVNLRATEGFISDISLSNLEYKIDKSADGSYCDALDINITGEKSLKQKQYPEFVNNLRELGKKYNYDYILVALNVQSAASKNYLDLVSKLDSLIFELDILNENRAAVGKCFSEADWLKLKIDGAILDQTGVHIFPSI